MFRCIGSYNISNIVKCVDNLTNDDWMKWRDLQELYRSEDSTQTYCLYWCMPDDSDTYRVTIYDDSSALAKACEDVINKLTRHFESKPIAVTFNKLLERRAIPPHNDPMYEGVHRIHIPIKTHPHVFMMDEKYKLHRWNEGKVYNLNAAEGHGVVNASRIDRIHMIIDIPSKQHIKPIIYEAATSTL